VIVPKRLSEAVGLWAGGVISPWFALGSLIRQQRMFHPRGVYFRAEVEAAEGVSDQFTQAVESLTQGGALVRMSPAIWQGGRGVMPDVLGMAVRFGADPAEDFRAQANAEDVSMITSRRLIGLPVAIFSTNQRDFLDNTYHGAGRYEIAGHPNMTLRAQPLGGSDPGQTNDRFTKLREAVDAGEVSFRIDAVARKGGALGSPLVTLRLVEEVAIDDSEVEFWPFRRGQEIRPAGLIQFMRPIPYLLSQYARNL
jgi:hypothetical protein